MSIRQKKNLLIVIVVFVAVLSVLNMDTATGQRLHMLISDFLLSP